MLRILIVEDEKPIANLITMNLRMEGYNCTTVYDGEEAADMLEKRTFDLVLLDIMLPQINGYELFEYIRPAYEKYVFHGSRKTEFALATLGNDAGIYGAAKLVLDK